MAPRTRHTATRFALILALAAALPLVAYGLVAILFLQSGTSQLVIARNLDVAARAAEEIRRHVFGHATILKSLAAGLEDTGLEQWQQDRILKNYVLQFREYREITLFDESGANVATSRIGSPQVGVPTADDRAGVDVGGVRMSPIRLDNEELPTAVFSVRLSRLNRPEGWLVGEISLEEMWRMVDEIRIGSRGFALVAAQDGVVIAHGDPGRQVPIAQSRNLSDHPLIADPAGAPEFREYAAPDGERQLAVAARIASLGWTVVVEQPTSEAYASVVALRRQLVVAIAVALLVTIVIGLLFGRRLIAPIFTLTRATQAVADGDLKTRVDIGTGDEFADLGHAFNRMADRLMDLQEDVKRQERQAMFGRIAAGLFHDLSHPVQNIANSTQLLMREDVDAREWATCHRTIQHELSALKRLMEDLRNITRPKPVERYAVDVSALVGEIVEVMRPHGERAGVTIEARPTPGGLVIDGDRFALGRVYRNLISNAIQATAPGGRVSIATGRSAGQVWTIVADTGSGIPAERLPRIFDDFVTTKRGGLGLGLAISKRIVEQLDGSIAVESEMGRGTSFTLTFPVRDERSNEAVAS